MLMVGIDPLLLFHSIWIGDIPLIINHSSMFIGMERSTLKIILLICDFLSTSSRTMTVVRKRRRRIPEKAMSAVPGIDIPVVEVRKAQ